MERGPTGRTGSRGRRQRGPLQRHGHPRRGRRAPLAPCTRRRGTRGIHRGASKTRRRDCARRIPLGVGANPPRGRWTGRAQDSPGEGVLCTLFAMVSHFKVSRGHPERPDEPGGRGANRTKDDADIFMEKMATSPSFPRNVIRAQPPNLGNGGLGHLLQVILSASSSSGNSRPHSIRSRLV